MRRGAAAGLAAGLLGISGLAGCATSAGVSSSAGASSSPPTRHAVARRAHRHRPERRGTLVVSTVSADVVQPQPAAGSCHARGTGPYSLPDRRCTPGAVSPAVTQANLRSTICHSGYSRTVRPPESVTEPEKVDSLLAYGIEGSARGYEYDHLVALELGGAANDPRNLWPEPGRTPNPKDELENRLRAMVCAGQIALATAQREIATDWVSLARRLPG